MNNNFSSLKAVTDARAEQKKYTILEVTPLNYERYTIESR